MRRAPDNPRLLLQEYQRRDFGAFLRKAYSVIRGGDSLRWNWHLDAIAYELGLVARGKHRRSMINVPPRNLKSVAVSVAWVAWMLGRDPKQNFVCISYSNALSAKFGRECLAIMQSSWYRDLFSRAIISSKRSAAHDFETTMGGGRLATSITGTLTGRGGDILIIDDPIKPDDAYSEILREGVNDWFKVTLSSRLDDKASGAIIAVMQRLHEHDLVGSLLSKPGWHQLKLPAIATEDEAIPIGRRKFHHRKAGDVLHAGRESREILEELKSAMGSAPFAAQYQQEPLPAVGNVVLAAWLKTYAASFDPKLASGTIVQSWDTASKDGAHNDFSVCVTALIKGREVYILEVFRQRLKFPDLKRHAIRLAREWRANDLLIEDQASGMQLIQALISEKPAGVPHPIARRPENDKKSRVVGMTGQIEAGQLLLPEEAHWLPDFKAELLGFPNTRFDDQCDAVSQLMDWVQRRNAYIDTTPLAGPIGISIDDEGMTHYSGDIEDLGWGTDRDLGDLIDDPWI